MRLEYLTLLVLAILPLWYKFGFWLYVTQLKEYRWDRFVEYLRTAQWKNALFQFWFFIEIPVLILSLLIFVSSYLEVMIYSVVIYFLIFQNFYVLWKMYRTRFLKPKITWRMVILSLAISFNIVLFSSLVFFWLHSFIYVFILSFITFPYFIITVWNLILYPAVYRKKHAIINNAILKSERIKDVIKIWVTWSYWKTSIKEFLWAILEKEWKLLKTPKNINTELWVSGIVLNELNDSYDYFLAEMWAYRVWEIEDLWKIVNHKYWFLTAVWNQHLWLFWSIENIKRAKSEIAKKVLENDWVLYVNWDDKNIREIEFPKKLKLVRYSLKQWDSDVKSEIIWFEDLITEFMVSYKWDEYTFKTNLIWKHNILNLTWVIAFCLDMWISVKNLKKYLIKMHAPEWTMKIENIKYQTENGEVNLTLLDDSYNLSEQWLIAWLKVARMFSGEKILVLDDVLELWKEANFIHFNLWMKIAKNSYVDKIFYVWVNYRNDFIKWLAAWGFDKSLLLNKLWEVEKDTVILFEWRRSGGYLNSYIK